MNTNADILRKQVIDCLTKNDISFKLIEHEAVYNMQQMNALNIDLHNEVVKNLFITDSKKERFFLLCTLSRVNNEDKRVDLKKLRKTLQSKPLRLASEHHLYQLTGLNTGSVSPFGILNDKDNVIEVLLDKDIKKLNHIAIHPNDNRATVWISPKGLERVFIKQGSSFRYVEV